MDDVIWSLHESVKSKSLGTIRWDMLSTNGYNGYSKDPIITVHIKSNSKLRLELNADTEFYIQSDIN